MAAAASVSKPLKVLIITSSGGGGLLQAANAKEQEIRLNHPDAVIYKRDIMKDWIWSGIGMFWVNLKWNQAQRKGDVSSLEWLFSVQKYADMMYWPIFFFAVLYFLFRENIDRIIDTQVMGTGAVTKAHRIYHSMRGKKVFLEKIVVDLPTDKATHFFDPVKKLSDEERKYLKLVTIEPLLTGEESEKDFWLKHCNLHPHEIHYEDLFVRQAFRKYQNRPRPNRSISLKFAVKNEEEGAFMKKTFQRGPIQFEESDGAIIFHIMPSHKLLTVLLGSQPAKATLHYIQKFIQIAKETGATKKPIYIFAFCADHEPGKKSFFQQVAEAVEAIEQYPENVSVIPISFQSDEAIAPLFFRSDLTCTRSGGQTAMELMCVSTGEVWIHSETKKEEDELSLDHLLQGIPCWEAGSAYYLKEKINAKIMTPEICDEHIRNLIGNQKNN